MHLLPRSAFGNVVVGMATAVVGPAVFRPLLVGVVRAGYEVKDYAVSAWNSAKAEAVSIHDEASRSKVASMETEIQQLRTEVAALRGTRKTA